MSQIPSSTYMSLQWLTSNTQVPWQKSVICRKRLLEQGRSPQSSKSNPYSQTCPPGSAFTIPLTVVGAPSSQMPFASWRTRFIVQSFLLMSPQGTGGQLGGKGGGGFGFGERGDGNGGIEGKGGSSGLGAIGGDGGAGGIKKISTENMSISSPKSSMINGCSLARATHGVRLSCASVHA